MIELNDENLIYYQSIDIKQLEKDRGKINHSDPSLYDIDNNFINSAADRYRTHQKKQYEEQEIGLLSERVRWTDRLRQGVRRGDWFIKWRINETEDSLQRVRRKLKYLSMPKKEQNNIDIALVKSIPISNIYEILPNGFFGENPLREESSPSNSLHWNKVKNTWKDFGTGDSGDNIDMVMRDKKCGFKEACEYILKFM